MLLKVQLKNGKFSTIKSEFETVEEFVKEQLVRKTVGGFVILEGKDGYKLALRLEEIYAVTEY